MRKIGAVTVITPPAQSRSEPPAHESKPPIHKTTPTHEAGPPIGDPAPTAPGRSRLRPTPLTGLDIGSFVVVNLVVISAMWVRHGALDVWGTSFGKLQGLGQITALWGSFFVLGELVLIARVPWIERRYGMDRLLRWHRVTGFVSVVLLSAHVLFTTLGYAIPRQVGAVDQFGNFILYWPNMLTATVGFALIMAVAVTSIRAARRSLSYETWHFIHMYAYLGVALAFAHQLTGGSDFATDRLAVAYWVLLNLATVAALIGFRWVTPIWRALYHRLRIAAIGTEGPGVVSIRVEGRHLDRLTAASGQFFIIRVLRRDRWWKAHPLSLSAAPNGRSLRFTVKALGDDSTWMQQIPIGTRIMAEGPYGSFHADDDPVEKVLLIGGGIGITPLRAIFESIERAPGQVTLLYRAHSHSDAILLDELQEIADRRGFRLHVSQSIDRRRQNASPFSASALRHTVPDIADRSIYICGPPELISAACNGARRAGAHPKNLHYERFDY